MSLKLLISCCRMSMSIWACLLSFRYSSFGIVTVSCTICKLFFSMFIYFPPLHPSTFFLYSFPFPQPSPACQAQLSSRCCWVVPPRPRFLSIVNRNYCLLSIETFKECENYGIRYDNQRNIEGGYSFSKRLLE